MLGSSVAPDVGALTRVVRGLHTWVADRRIDGVASPAPQYGSFVGGVSFLDTVTISGLVQRPYLMTAGFLLSETEGEFDMNSLVMDNGALLSRVLMYDDESAALAIGENVPVPLKFVRIPAGLTGYAPGVTLTYAFALPPGVRHIPWFTTVNASGGIAGGNRYDCYFQNVAVCRDNRFYIRNLTPGGSVRVSVNGGATVVHNVDAGGRINADLAEAIFPAKVTVELFTGVFASGRRYGYQIIRRAYGGDEYAGRGGTLTPAIAIAARTAWVATASRSAGGGTPPSSAIDADLITRWETGGAIVIATDWFRIDTSAEAHIGGLRINNGPYPGDNPATGEVWTSLNGVLWELRAGWTEANIAAGVLSVGWFPIKARYVRLIPTSLATTPANSWSIADLTLIP